MGKAGIRIAAPACREYVASVLNTRTAMLKSIKVRARALDVFVCEPRITAGEADNRNTKVRRWSSTSLGVVVPYFLMLCKIYD